MRSFAPVGILFLAALACESANSERIAAWKGTQKGPDKIEAALRSGNVPANLRAEAAAALVDIGRPEKVDEIMATLDAGERLEILKTLVAIHIKGMASPQVPKAREARDGLFSLRQFAPPAEQKRIDDVLLASIEKDLAEGRFTGSRHSLDKMLSAIGPAAGPMLVRLLGDPKSPAKGLAELLVKVCDEPTRDKGGVALLGRISAPGQPMASDMWLTLGMLGGPAVSEFLAGKMQKGSPEEAINAAKALQQTSFPSVLPLALKIAADAKANKELRGEAFGVIEKVGGPEAEHGLLRIIAEDKNDIVRYRAHEAALEIGKGDAIVPALQAFSGKLSFKREDVVDFLVKDISKLGAKAKPQVLVALASSSALARMTAILALETNLPANPRARMGGPEDAAPLLKLAQDTATIKGFPPNATVGAEAKRVAALLQGKEN
jgi:HEAT repeat protein